MGLEAATYVSSLQPANPLASDLESQGDDHLRLIKTVLQATFPNASKPFYFENTVAAKSANYTVVDDDRNRLIPCNCAAGNITISLPNMAASSYDGFTLRLVKTEYSSNSIIIDPYSTVLINEQSTLSFNEPFNLLTLVWSVALGQWFCDFRERDPVGSIKGYSAPNIAPAGYVMLNGGTIGNASSAGTVRANADTQQLFELLWNNTLDADCPVNGGRGASAAADFAADKRITLPDARGRTLVGNDTMNNGAAGVIGAVLTSRIAFKAGAEREAITQAQLPNYTLPNTLAIASAGNHAHTVNVITTQSSGGATGPLEGQDTFQTRVYNTSTAGAHIHAITGSVTSGGSGTLRSQIQPSLCMAWIIKL